MTDEDDPASFWRWVARNHESMAARAATGGYLNEMDRRVAALGCPAWEIGPMRDGWYLALSPGGDREALARINDLVGRAPMLRGWEFRAGKPPKDWHLQFSLDTASGRVDLDAGGWRVVLYRFPDGIFDIVVLLVGGGADALDPADRLVAARLALEGQLGEMELLTGVNAVDAVLEPSDALVARSVAMSDLRPREEDAEAP